MEKKTMISVGNWCFIMLSPLQGFMILPGVNWTRSRFHKNAVLELKGIRDTSDRPDRTWVQFRGYGKKQNSILKAGIWPYACNLNCCLSLQNAQIHYLSINSYSIAIAHPKPPGRCASCNSGLPCTRQCWWVRSQNMPGTTDSCGWFWWPCCL